MPKRNYWLLKTEPETYSIQDLAQEPNQTTSWEGVRNYQARNLLRDEIKRGDWVIVYHSQADPPAAMGIAEVVRAGYPDHFAWNRRSKYFDEKSTAENPRWYMIDIQLKEIFQRPVSLTELREVPALSKMELLRKGSRLSVQPVRREEFQAIQKLAQRRM